MKMKMKTLVLCALAASVVWGVGCDQRTSRNSSTDWGSVVNVSDGGATVSNEARMTGEWRMTQESWDAEVAARYAGAPEIFYPEIIYVITESGNVVAGRDLTLGLESGGAYSVENDVCKFVWTLNNIPGLPVSFGCARVHWQSDKLMGLESVMRPGVVRWYNRVSY
jgi:hypothetical protein